MQVTFLGTGTSQGVPVITCTCDVCRSVDFRDKRLRTSIHIQHNDTSIVIDTGPDFRQQMLRERITRLDAVLFTHEHKDHTAGLDDVRSFNFAQQQDMPVYGRRRVLDQLKQEYAYVFAEHKYPGIPEITLHELDGTHFHINGIKFLPIEVLHYKLPVYGFRVDDFTYITDCSHIPEEEQEKIKGSKVLVLDALQRDQHISHFNLEQALEMIEKLRPERAFLTHAGHRLGKYVDVSKELPAHVELAYDGLKVEV